MNEVKKNRIANFFTVLVLVLSAMYVAVALNGGYNWLAWFLAIANLIAGPACLIGYIREVRKGIFDDVEEVANKE